MTKAPGILGLPIDYCEFKKWAAKDRERKKIWEENPDIHYEDLRIRLIEWEKTYDEAAERKINEAEEKEENSP